MNDIIYPRGLPASLTPYEPSGRDPWNLRKACHLYRRAGFGATVAEMDQAEAAGFDATVNRLIRVDTSASELDRFLSTVRTELFDFGDEVETAQAFWLYRCVATERPYAEKMALFWHGHFATANYKVNSPELMYQQYRTLSDHGRGRFEDLLLQVARNPAMLIWLDGNVNRKGSPNENFARELLELFSMGPGPYTETDIQEGARASTGWQTKGGTFAFNIGQHDSGEKVFLGERGAFGGEDIIRIVAASRHTALFLSRKLLNFFVMPDPPDAVVNGLADVYLANEGSIQVMCEVIFRSRLFYSDAAHRALIKSPTELVVGALRILDANTNRKLVLGAMTNMGQELFNPPNVKGWDGDATWLNTVTTLERVNFLNQLMLRTPVKVEGRDHLLLQALKDRGLRGPSEVVEYFVNYLLQGDVTAEQR